jgi:hypothetical protein
MSTISTALRNFKEPTKEQLTQIFFSLPGVGSLDGTEKTPAQEVEKMDINAVLSLGIQGEEDAYVSSLTVTGIARGSQHNDLRRESYISWRRTWRSRRSTVNQCASLSHCPPSGAWSG